MNNFSYNNQPRTLPNSVTGTGGGYRMSMDLGVPQHQVCGDFSVEKGYTVERRDSNTGGYTRQGVNGTVFQVVTRETDFVDGYGNRYNKDNPRDIDEFTRGQVMNSNDRYIEAFPIRNGLVPPNNNPQYPWDGRDTFGSGALAHYKPYGKGKNRQYYAEIDQDDISLQTKGHVNVIGDNYFVSENNPQHNTIFNEFSVTPEWRDYQRQNNINQTGRVCDNCYNAANGLPYQNYTPSNHNQIIQASEVSPVTHEVNASWRFGTNDTIVNQRIYPTQQPNSNLYMPNYNNNMPQQNYNPPENYWEQPGGKKPKTNKRKNYKTKPRSRTRTRKNKRNHKNKRTLLK